MNLANALKPRKGEILLLGLAIIGGSVAVGIAAISKSRGGAKMD